MHVLKFWPFNKNEVWIIKDNPDFDVATGSFNEAEICELAALYFLDILRKEFGNKKLVCTEMMMETSSNCLQKHFGLEFGKVRKKTLHNLRTTWVKCQCTM